ncbi:MAG: Clp protease N-terminal domain-containing protein, partial [Candidatus Microthrix subdominans]
MPLDPNTWTLKTQEAIGAAQQAASERANPEVTPDHVLGALLRQSEGVVLPLVRRLELDPVAVRNAADEAVAALPQSHGGETRFGREFTALLDEADTLREGLTDEYLSTEHLFLALVNADQKRSPGSRRLGEVDRDQVLSALQEIRGSQRVTSQSLWRVRHRGEDEMMGGWPLGCGRRSFLEPRARSQSGARP